MIKMVGHSLLVRHCLLLIVLQHVIVEQAVLLLTWVWTQDIATYGVIQMCKPNYMVLKHVNAGKRNYYHQHYHQQ
jgi:hypothetical protein